MLVSAALSSRKMRRSGAIASSAMRQSCRAWAITASFCSAARGVFFFARRPQAPERSAHRPGMDAEAGLTGLIGKLVPVLRQGPMSVALNQALESRFRRIADHRLRASTHLLGAIAALLAPLLEP